MLLVLAVLTMVVGILGALVQDDLKRLLSFTIVSHIGYMLLGLGLASTAGLAGAVALHRPPHRRADDAVPRRRPGRAAGGHRLAAPGRRAAARRAAARRALPAAGAVAGRDPAAVGLRRQARRCCRRGSPTAARSRSPPSPRRSLTSLLTLYAVGRVWSEVFWGPVAEVVPDADRSDAVDVGTARTPRLMLGAAAVAVVGGLAITVVAGPLYALSERAAEDLVDPRRLRHGRARRRAGDRRRVDLALVLWLTAVWVGLWGSVTAANVLGGLAVALVAASCCCRCAPASTRPASCARRRCCASSARFARRPGRVERCRSSRLVLRPAPARCGQADRRGAGARARPTRCSPCSPTPSR